jgi:hypothetical protein
MTLPPVVRLRLTDRMVSGDSQGFAGRRGRNGYHGSAVEPRPGQVQKQFPEQIDAQLPEKCRPGGPTPLSQRT